MNKTVTFKNTLPPILWTQEKKPVPELLTGTVRREFKNGCVAVSINELGGAIHHIEKSKISG